jgi:hypothetical protein
MSINRTERFLWFVSLSLNKEMNPAVGLEPDDFNVKGQTHYSMWI